MAAPAKTREVFEYLKTCAGEMRTVTYKEVADVTDLAPVGLAYQLGYIRDEICRKRGLPWLSAIVVGSESRTPGSGFLPEDVSFGDAGNRLWRGMVLHVFAFDWDAVQFDDAD
jgi:hypothetical protein